MEIARLTFRPARINDNTAWGAYVAKDRHGLEFDLCDNIHDFYEIGESRRFDVVVSNAKPRHRQFNKLIYRDGCVGIDHGPASPGPRYVWVFFSSFRHWLNAQYEAGARYIWLEIDA